MAYPRSADGTPIQASHKLKLGRAPFQNTVDGTEPMNINGTSGGGATVIWNGTGAGDTGGDWTQGGSAGQTETAGAMHAGTNGLDTGGRSKDDTTEYDNGSLLDINGTYQDLTFWMQPKAFPSGAKVKVDWRDAGGSKVGVRLSLADYVTNFDLDVWQQVTIPIADFALTADVQKLRFKYTLKANQHFYWDDIEVVQAGGGGQGATTFRVAAPDATVRYHVERIVLVVVAGATGWSAMSFGDISGGLMNGLLLRHNEPGAMPDPIVHWSLNTKDNAQLYGQYKELNEVAFDSERLITMVIEPTVSAIEVTDTKFLEVIVRDNLSSLADLRAFLHYGVEDILV